MGIWEKGIILFYFIEDTLGKLRRVGKKETKKLAKPRFFFLDFLEMFPENKQSLQQDQSGYKTLA